MKALLTLAALLFVLACGRQELAAPPAATDGVDVGNGGDTFAGEFVEVGYELAELLNHQPMPGISSEELERALRMTKVISSETLELDEKPIDALNFPKAKPPRIVLNRTAWKRMRDQRHEKVVLVLHEYLGILGKDDSNYQISRKLDRSGVCERNPVIRDFLENQVRKSCYRITIDDLRYIYSMDLPHQGITSINPGDFDHLVQIETINLFDNEIKTIAKGIFHDLSRLKSLNLAHNKIAHIDSHAFQGLPALQGLNLNGNALKRLPGFAFDGLEAKRVGTVIDDRLPFIDFNMNSMEALETGAFQGMVAEEVLLDTFKSLEPGAFRGLSAKKWLSFSVDASHGTISSGAMNGLGDVPEVSIDIQWPGKLSPNFFAPLVKVKRLRLASWKTPFTKEQLAVLDKLPALEAIHFSSYLNDLKLELDIDAALPSFKCKDSYNFEGPKDCVKLGR